MAPQSNALIAKLLAAEQDAETIVAAAREGRAKALREARDAAQAETETFRQKEEEKYAEAVKNLTGASEQADFDKQASAELKEVQRDLQRNKDGAVKYIFDKVMAVDTSLTSIQISHLKLEG